MRRPKAYRTPSSFSNDAQGLCSATKGAQDFCGLLRLRRLQLQMRPEVIRLQAHIDIKRTELAIAGTHFVEAHFVNDLLQRVELVRHESHTPFPIVEPGRAGDQLADSASEFASNSRMAAHEFFACFEIEHVPIV